MLVCILVISFSVRKDKKPDTKKSFFTRNFSLPPLGKIASTFMVDQGWIQVNSISKIFLKSLEFLKDNFGDNSLYRLPWYIVVGAKNSGKSTILNHTHLHEPHESPDFSLFEANPSLRWKFFSRGVVIDVAGRLFLNDTENETDTINWRNLLILLARYRPIRPLNGIILCINVKDLYGKEKLSPDELQVRANAMSHTLNKAQTSLRMCLPIYVIVTNCDAIPGFQSFIQELSPKNQGNMLGWSSPYNLQYAYSPEWVDEAYNYLDDKIDSIRTELLSSSIDPDNADGLFVFSKEILTTQENLGAFLNRIFHASATHEAPILRGIYFTGNSITNDANLSFANNDSSPSLSLNAHSNATVFPVFLKDLFQSKIFQEFGIARPLSGSVSSLNRGVNIIRNATICFTLIGTYALFNAYDSFTEKKDRFLPVLSKLSTLLRAMQNLRFDEPGHTATMFDSYARQLLMMLRELQETKFFSAAIPASWFSPLHDNLQSGFEIAYQEIVIRTIYVDLLLKAKTLLQLKPTKDDRSTSLAALLNPLTCSEYVLLKKYVEGLYVLNDMLFKFNNLKSASDASDLDSLVAYTFDSHLPEQFSKEYASFRKILSRSTYPLIDLKPYQQMARHTLSILYENFLNALFSKNDPLTLISRIQVLIDQLQGQNERHLPDLEKLRTAVGDLTAIVSGLGEPGVTWMDSKIFTPGKEFEKILDHIDASPLFGKDVTQYLVDQTAIGFNRYKKFLTIINESLVDKDLNQKNLPPSHGIIILEKYLTSLFKLSFMGTPSSKKLATEIPSGKLLYWNTKLVQTTYNMMKDFDNFVTKDLPSYPQAVQENIKMAAKQNLQDVLIGNLGTAQTFLDAPKDIKPGTAAERILRAQISDFKEVVDPLGKLLEVLKHDDVSKAYIDLRNLLCGQSQWLLKQIDVYLKHQNFYKMKHENFDWWDGKVGASIGAFALRDNGDLKAYIAVQRQIITSVINDYAKPVVELIKNPAFEGADGRDEALINNWVKLTDEVEAYGKKKPNNSLATLENFILKDLNNAKFSDILKTIKIEESSEASGDYLIDIFRYIKHKVRCRAEILQRQEAIKHYEHMVAFFNKHLRGKFPFVGANLDKNKGEANPDDIREFFEMFKQAGDSTKLILDQLYQVGPEMKDPVMFLLAMEDIREFFGDYIKDPNVNSPSFNIKVDFRTSRDKENGGNLIVDWYIKTDETTIIDKQDKKTEGSWSYGNPITVGFKWPESKDVPHPVSDSRQPSLKVEDATAEYVYDSHWALLWLIRDHMAPTGSFSKVANPNPYVLKFNLPLNDQSYTRVFNSISLTSASKAKGPPKVMMMPNFPTSAPELPQTIKEIKAKPVFTEKTLEAADFDIFAGKKPEDDAKSAPAKEKPKKEEKPSAPAPKEQNEEPAVSAGEN